MGCKYGMSFFVSFSSQSHTLSLFFHSLLLLFIFSPSCLLSTFCFHIRPPLPSGGGPSFLFYPPVPVFFFLFVCSSAHSHLPLLSLFFFLHRKTASCQINSANRGKKKMEKTKEDNAPVLMGDKQEFCLWWRLIGVQRGQIRGGGSCVLAPLKAVVYRDQS